MHCFTQFTIIFEPHGLNQTTGQDSILPAGVHEVQWHGDDGLGNLKTCGMYICRIRAGEVEQTITLMLLK
ncbi:hypothetical protein JW935_09675 [candidate division KSB1 bacterium]|nr:hypothetical protein [candidate division KSB1 bacterium]